MAGLSLPHYYCLSVFFRVHFYVFLLRQLTDQLVIRQLTDQLVIRQLTDF